MKVTRVEAVTKTKYKVFLDEQFAFELYKGELSRYQIAEGAQISETIYEMIRQEVILKRIKLRALHLLNVSDRTEADLRNKLRQSHYPEDLIEEAVAYVKRFGYINDEEYVRRYMEYKSGSKSKIQIKMDLRKKGITAETLERVFEEYEYEEDDILEEQVKKRIRQKGSVTKENFQKYYGYFARKGFNSGKILDLLRKYMED